MSVTYEYMTRLRAWEVYGCLPDATTKSTDPCLVAYDPDDGAVAVIPYHPSAPARVRDFETSIKWLADEALAKLRSSRDN